MGLSLIAEPKRACGGCTLCCKLVPVEEIEKDAGERCKFQRFGKGCSIYARRPHSCVHWSCRWLTEENVGDLRRPDRSHYVIDTMPDFITFQYDDTGERENVPVLQIWVDPSFPDAHRDPALRTYLDRKGEDGYAALIRYDASDAFVIFPPSMTNGAGWVERHSNRAEGQHSMAEIMDALR